MKTQNIIFGFICFILVAFSSCESYLDKKEDEPLTFDKIWTKREYILRYYGNVWAHILRDDDIEDGHPYIGASDDAVLSYKGKGYIIMNNGTWSPSNIPYRHGANNDNPTRGIWLDQYRGIREANIFLANIDKSTANNVSPEDIKAWKAEVRFVRAYLTFQLVRLYGPIILVHDDPVDFKEANFTHERSPLNECVKYIVDELTELSTVFPSEILVADAANFGKPTKGTCLALIGRVKLYAARKLFNGNPMYAGIQNKDGTVLFPASPDPNKWREAADANWALINHSETQNDIYKLHSEATPYLSYQNLFISLWNKEIIFGRYGGRYDVQVLLTPAVIGGTAYGGSGPTQSMVDAYAMKNGKYPITGYTGGGTPVIDPASGYSESGFTSFTHPIDATGKGALSTYNMYIDREPRFYASVLWSGAWWPANKKNPVYAYNGNSGPGPRHDYPPTGYITRKFINPSSDTGASGGWGNITWPVIRLAEIYLNYVEALNECDPTNPHIFTYINKVRTRAGVPNIELVYPEVAGGANPNIMRELIRKERQVELFFECHRYFDTRQWMIAEAVNGGPMYGMNVMARVEEGKANETPIEFWERSVSENRIFEPKHYLHPIHQEEIDRNPNLTQNYGW